MKIDRSNKSGKKWMATFTDKKTGRTKTTHFGASGMNDYTLTGDKQARGRYRMRHKKDLNTNDPTRAGYLSYYLLWGESKSLQTNITKYKKRFNV